jgi:hypothetical protein
LFFSRGGTVLVVELRALLFLGRCSTT